MTDEAVQAAEPMQIDSGLAKRVQQVLGQNVYLCYQCSKCSSGCQVAEFFDWQPNQIMRAVQLGQEDIALHAETPWLCASCQTCTTRCPQALDIAGIMDFLTREARARGIKSPVPEVEIFNQAFMREIRLWRRAFELGLLAEIKLRTLRPDNVTEDLDLGLKMMLKRKLPFIPSPSRKPKNPKPIKEAETAVAYYPGCSLHSTAVEFNQSTLAVAEALELELYEPKGWACCGSSAAHRADPETAFRLPLENISLIESLGFEEVSMPCAACFSRHKFAQHEAEHQSVPGDVDYRGTLKVNNLIDTLIERVGLEKVVQKVRQPLEGLKVVSYYGCLLTRPPQVTGAPHPENPTSMDALLKAAGAEVLDWSYKTSCCGAAHSLAKTEIVFTLSSQLIDHARQAGAEAIAVACPLCHTNLDARQMQMDLDEPMPVLYFTQLMGLALGLHSKKLGLGKNIIDPRPMLRRRGFLDGDRKSDEDTAESDEDDSAYHRGSRAPPTVAEVRMPPMAHYEDALEIMEAGWLELCDFHDVHAPFPNLQHIFHGVEINQPTAAAERTIANMLAEMPEHVDRFSAWYNCSADDYGIQSSRSSPTAPLEWVLNPAGRQRWQRLINYLAVAIRKDSGLIMASVLLEDLAQNASSQNELVRAYCGCMPPRVVLLSRRSVQPEAVVCELCQQPFRHLDHPFKDGPPNIH